MKQISEQASKCEKQSEKEPYTFSPLIEATCSSSYPRNVIKLYRHPILPYSYAKYIYAQKCLPTFLAR